MAIAQSSEGIYGPLRVFDQAQCAQIVRALMRDQIDPPLDWDKGRAAHCRMSYQVARHPQILQRVRYLLGANILLWGASVVRRKPGQHHAWHSDIEAAVPGGNTLSVWVALQNVSRASALTFLTHSHQFGPTLQEARARHGNGVPATSDEVLRWGQLYDTRCRLETVDMRDGEVIFFSGRQWHCSHNTTDQERLALLLQYATPDAPIRIPDLNYREWPFRVLAQPKPACIMIHGSDHTGANRIVPGPPVNRLTRTLSTSRVQPIGLPLAPDNDRGWKPYHLFKGSTAHLDSLSCHVSILNPGESPHPPHAHPEEEILIVLDGEVEVELPDLSDEQMIPLQAGQFVYYPGGFHHTIRSTGSKPATYLMFKWFAEAQGQEPTLGYSACDISLATRALTGNDRFTTHKLLQGKTTCLHRLRSHVSVLPPGEGYPPHRDAYDVAIVTLAGEVETLGERVGPHHVIFYPAGESHGMHNPGDIDARYVVFEFESGFAWPAGRQKKRRPFLQKLRDPRSWRRKIQKIQKRLTG